MTQIPKQLQNPEFRFIKLQKNSKNPIMGEAWLKNLYSFNNPELLEHIKNGGNYGIVGGYGRLRILDIDDKELAEELISKISTFTVQTCGGFYHFYLISDYDKNCVFKKGEMRSNNLYVVGPGCYAIDEKKDHDGKYEVIKDIEMKEVNIETIERFIGKVENIQKKEKEIVEINKNRPKDDSRSGLEYRRIIALLREGKNKEEIFKIMLAYSKWKDAVEQYREHTYNSAKDFFDREKEMQPITNVEKIVENLQQECYNLMLTRKEDAATELIAAKIKEMFIIYTIRDDIKCEMWIYNDGIYIPNGISYIKEVIRNILGILYTVQRVNKVIAKIEADTYIAEDDFFKNNILEEIPVLNGILNLRTLELSKYTPKKIFFNKIPIIFNEEKKCPNIDKFFEDVLSSPEDKKVIYEIFGYCLWKDSFLEQAIMANGDGSNGKGKTLSLLKTFLGDKSYISIPLSELVTSNFDLSGLFGKLANIAGDLSNITLKDTGALKTLTGRDPLTTKRKFKSSLTFVNYSKQLFACNDLPIVYDTSYGFWRRWILLDFPYKFIDKTEYNKLSDEEKKKHKIKNVNILNTIATSDELSGLLNKALIGLHTILKNGRFSYSKGTIEVKDLWIRKSNSFVAFCMDKLESSDSGIIAKNEIRKEFMKYCKKHKIRGASDTSIKITLESEFGAISLFPTSYKNITNEYAWEGIKFKETSEK